MSLESCLLRLLFAFALTGACSASLNVFARSSGFLVLRGVIRFGGAGAQCTSWRVSCVWFVRVGRIPACAANSTGAFLDVPRVNAFRLSSTRLRVACASLVEGALRKACPSGNCHFVGFDLRTSCLCFPSGSLLRKYVPRKLLPVAFVTCSRANRCLLGFSKCSRTFVWLLSPSGCDSFRAAGA